MKVIITGGSGFLGKHLSVLLNQHNIEYEDISLENGVDVTNWELIKNFNKFSVLIQLASKIFVPESFINPRSYFYTNLMSTVNCLELCRINNAKMIYISSYVYGKPDYLPVDEKHTLKGHNPYSDSKIIAERLCQSYFDNFGLKIVILRPFNIYGPGQSGNLLIPSICSQLKNSEILLKDPAPKRDYIYVADVVDAILKSINKDFDKMEYINLGTSLSYSVREVVEKMIHFAGTSVKVKFLSTTRTNEVSDVRADIHKARKLLDWNPKIGIDEGLKLVVEHDVR